MASMIINAIIKAKQGKEQALREEMLKMIEPSRAEKGCLEYSLLESLEDQRVFVFYEIWKDKESLQNHTETNHYKEYRYNIETLVDSREVFYLQKIVQEN